MILLRNLVGFIANFYIGKIINLCAYVLKCIVDITIVLFAFIKGDYSAVLYGVDRTLSVSNAKRKFDVVTA
jgi:hypothetical protein